MLHLMLILDKRQRIRETRFWPVSEILVALAAQEVRLKVFKVAYHIHLNGGI